ncbi:MAG: DUF86 domain-containing protein [Candidatus Gastranaerophilales bacterium]|nr:DUF86 domain-containing protein [Candidatus Gastranaerophilales bacterium]
MKNKEPVFFLKDIKNSLDKIFKYTDNIEFEDFINDDKTKDAVERNFEIIGEAVKNLPADFKSKYPNIPFRQIAGMRDKLIHDYFGIDYEIIWKTIQDKLPEFKQNIEDLIEKHS